MRAIFDLVRPPVVSRTAPTWSEQILMEHKKRGWKAKCHGHIGLYDGLVRPILRLLNLLLLLELLEEQVFFFLFCGTRPPLPLPTGTGRAFFFLENIQMVRLVIAPEKKWLSVRGWVGLVAPYHPLVGGICRRSSEGTGSIFGAAFRNRRRRRKRAGEREKGFLVVFTAVRHCQMLTAAF